MTICYYHSRDLDGWCSAAIVAKYCDENNRSVKLVGWDYGKPLPSLSQIEENIQEIIVVDIAFPKKLMLKLDEMTTSGLIWIDHHKSAIDQLPNSLKGLRDAKFAACELTWKYFYPEVDVPLAVELLGLYDSFRHKGTSREKEVLAFQWGARSEFNDPMQCAWLLKPYCDCNTLIKKGYTILQYLNNEALQIFCEHDALLHIDGVEFVAFNRERFNPINFGIDYHKDYEAAACFWYNARTDNWTFSLYNDNGKVDCSEIAKKFGGGGHKGAAGFVVENIDEFLKQHIAWGDK